MKDRYLFRAKCEETGYWVFGIPVNLIDELFDDGVIHGITDTTNGYDFQENFDVDPDTVGQCTGLKDKNGKLIFEGDIVLLNSRAKEYKVVFKDGGFCLEHDIEPDWQDYIPFNGHNNFDILMSNIVVTGNIHESSV